MKMAERYRLLLTDSEQTELKELISKGKGAAKRIIRAQILMAVAENVHNLADKQVSVLYGKSTKSIERLRKRCCQEGLEVALNGKKREVFKEKRITGEVEAKLTMLACSQAPEGYNRWTLELLADEMVRLNYIDSISHTSVGTVLKKTKLSPGGRRCG
jgi:transposase